MPNGETRTQSQSRNAGKRLRLGSVGNLIIIGGMVNQIQINALNNLPPGFHSVETVIAIAAVQMDATNAVLCSWGPWQHWCLPLGEVDANRAVTCVLASRDGKNYRWYCYQLIEPQRGKGEE